MPLVLQGNVITATEAAYAAQGMAAAVGNTNMGPGQDQITDALSKMPRAALYDIMVQMKGLIQQNQQQARQILVTNPSLTRALFQAQILLNMLPNPLSEPPQGDQQGAALPQAPLQQPGRLPGAVPQQAPYQQPHMQQPQAQQHVPAVRPQHMGPNPTTNPNNPYPQQELPSAPPVPLPGAPQPLRNPHGQPMPGVRPASAVTIYAVPGDMHCCAYSTDKAFPASCVYWQSYLSSPATTGTKQFCLYNLCCCTMMSLFLLLSTQCSQGTIEVTWTPEDCYIWRFNLTCIACFLKGS